MRSFFFFLYASNTSIYLFLINFKYPGQDSTNLEGA